MNRPYSLNYARLASGAFYETIVPVTFYEIIFLDGSVKSLIFVFPPFRRKPESSPARSGIKKHKIILDSGFHRSDEFLRSHLPQRLNLYIRLARNKFF
jgi:hypothetical protein